MKLGIIGVPFNSSGATGGEALGPSVLREQGLIDSLSRHNQVTDYGDVEISSRPSKNRDVETGIIAPQVLIEMVAAVRQAVAKTYADRVMPVLVGGDCPLLLGGLLAARDQLGYGPGLIFVDGHEDAYPPFGSLTGESADMELGLALGLTRAEGLGNLATELPVIDLHEVVLLGPRDADELRSEGIESVGHRVIVLDDTRLRDAGVRVTIQRWMDQLQHQPGRFWFHLDWDVLSSDDMPAVSYPQPGGLVWDEVEEISRAAFHDDHLIGIDLTIYNPDIDPDRTHARRIVNFLANVTREPEREPLLGRIN